MMNKILIIDCQTTALHPKNGHILQLGWCEYDEESKQPPEIHKRWLQLPADEKLSKKITKLLNIATDELEKASPPAEVMTEFQENFQALSKPAVVMAHYAPFETNFLQSYFSEFLNQSVLPFKILCTKKLAKKLIPNLPSYSLKALAGYFKLDVIPLNDVTTHIQATLAIWKKLKAELSNLNFSSYEQLSIWLENRRKGIKPLTLHYNIDRIQRLELPAQPGIYQFLSHEKKILYIGKATSLKSRVNSYFRGLKNRSKRISEMLAQVWDIEFIVCDTVLEAELLEACEIKKLNPPYNIRLNNINQNFIYYQRDFSNSASSPTEYFCEGPYKMINPISDLLMFHQCYLQNKECHLYSQAIAAETIQSAWTLFASQHNISIKAIDGASPRNLLAIGLILLRQFESKLRKFNFERWWTQKKKALDISLEETPEYFATKIYRLFLRAAESKRNTRHLNLLNNADLLFHDTKKLLNLRLFLLNASNLKASTNTLVATHYDQLCIILSAQRKKLVRIIKR